MVRFVKIWGTEKFYCVFLAVIFYSAYVIYKNVLWKIKYIYYYSNVKTGLETSQIVALL